MHIAVAFDESLASSFRNEIYPAYKANREPAPPELKRQFAWCRELCRHFGIAEFGSSTHEADDIIGTIAARFRSRGHRAVLVTRDKDLAQLIHAGDAYWDWAAERRLEYADIEGHFGVRPERMADFLALAGDSVDNIPGVPGVGPKTASALLREFASLEEIYDGLERVASLPIRGAGKLAAKLTLHREAAFLARRLTTIACDMPMEVTAEQLAPPQARSCCTRDLLRSREVRRDAAPAGATHRRSRMSEDLAAAMAAALGRELTAAPEAKVHGRQHQRLFPMADRSGARVRQARACSRGAPCSMPKWTASSACGRQARCMCRRCLPSAARTRGISRSRMAGSGRARCCIGRKIRRGARLAAPESRPDYGLERDNFIGATPQSNAVTGELGGVLA